jgi:site-specific recombinase XerD
MDVDNLLTTFEKYLKAQNLSKNTVMTYMDDVSYYLSEKNRVENSLDGKNFVEIMNEDNLLKYFENILCSTKYDNDTKLKSKLKRTVSKKISSFSKFLEYLKREKIIDTNYIKTLDRSELIGKYEKSLEHKNYIDQKELYDFTHKLCEIANSPDKDFIVLRDTSILLVLIFTGLRASELGDIRTSDVDLKNNRIDDVSRKRGKESMVPINKRFLKPILKRYLRFRDIVGPRDIDNLFYNKMNRPISRQLVYKIVEKYSLKFLGYKIHPHTLRHTFATCLLLNGATTAEVRKMLDHENITSTEVYEHVNEIKSKYNLINNFYRGNNE